MDALQSTSGRSGSGCSRLATAALGLALLLGALLGCNESTQSAQAEAPPVSARVLGPTVEARVKTLESNVEQLGQQLDQQGEQQRTALKVRAQAAVSEMFEITCPEPWQALGPVDGAAWTCRSPAPAAGGLWPNCNVTTSPSLAEVDAKRYFDSALAAVPQLRDARRIEERESTLDGVTAHEAVYEHRLLPSPLRVLATVVVHRGRAFAVNCSAPPEAFENVEPTFRSITGSFRFSP